MAMGLLEDGVLVTNAYKVSACERQREAHFIRKTSTDAEIRCFGKTLRHPSKREPPR